MPALRCSLFLFDPFICINKGSMRITDKCISTHNEYDDKVKGVKQIRLLFILLKTSSY